ncbi:MAG: YczE/YyaS/YitT family protein [Massiliimalia sp.]|jgi:uncharacterized membrane protein YczE
MNWFRFRLNRYMVKRLGMMCVGVFFMGLAVTIYNKTKFGTDPFTAMVLGVSNRLNISFGVTQLGINCVIILLGVFFGRQFLGIGTVINMTCVGFIADFTTFLYDKIFPDPDNMPARIIMFTIIFILHCFGGSIFFTAALGVGAYDIVGFVMNDRLHINYRWCRVTTDVICVIIGFSLGSIIGVGTVLTAFFMGPIIQFFTDHFSVPFLNKELEAKE